jgi:choline dehydrogenase-like flavoprotein
MQSFDFIIVGAGSAGCVLADKLSACGKFTVCLIEAGPPDNHWMTEIPLAVVTLMRSKRRNWQLNSEPEPYLHHRKIFNPRGKTLGGSSSINAMLYVRGQKEDYDHWAALGNPGWAYDDVLPYFKATEHQERGADSFHGVDGALNVCDSQSKPEINDYFIQAAHDCGYPLNEDFNGASQEGIGYFQVTQKNGLRCSSAKGFLTPNLARKNLTVLTNIHVSKLLIENKQAIGIQYQQKNKTIELHANKEVIVSAGAFHSPQLLMLSGIGDPEQLKEHKIEVIHPLKGVGKNLQDHLDILTVNKINYHQVLAYRPKSAWWITKQLTRFLTKRQGIATSVIAESGGFIKSDNALQRPDLQLHFIPAAMDDHGRNSQQLLQYGMALHACLLRPKSTGEVKLANKISTSAPKIYLNMLSHPDDMQVMVKAVKICRDIFSQSSLAKLIVKAIYPKNHCQSDEQIKEFIRSKANTIYHPVGTCKMGNDKDAVVDSHLLVHGMNNLRVVDASIMPTIISGNTNAPTIMIAAKAADMILAVHQ